MDELVEVTEGFITAIALLAYGLVEYLKAYEGLFELLGVCIVVVTTLLLAQKFKARLHRSRITRRGNRMRKGDRKVFVKTFVADKITDILEDAAVRGILRDNEVSRLYRQLSFFFDNDQLRPRKLSREELVRRLHKMVKTSKKPSIPGPKPGEGLVVAKTEPKPTNVVRFKYLNRKAA